MFEEKFYNVGVNVSPYYRNAFRVLREARDNWWHCREEFSRVFTYRTGSILFYATNNISNIARFLNKFEEKLGLQPKEKLKFYRTSEKMVIGIKVSHWWKSQWIRRQLLTALIRCGEEFNGRNFKKALYSSKYTCVTKNAVDYFLKGYTITNPKLVNTSGWRATFFNKTPKQVKQILLKP